MGFGGGAFGTGSYQYSTIDNETIKLNQQKGVIYANQSALSPSTDNNTIYLNSNNQIAVKPSAITQSGTLQDITISSNTTLTSDLYCNNLTINSGVTLTTNGYNIYCQGTFTNNGTINTGTLSNGGIGGNNGSVGGTGGSEKNSYAGSGGGGTNGTGIGNSSAGSGGSTLVAGGGVASSGSTPSAPTITNSLIQSWYNNGFQNYLAGAGGGGGGSAEGGNGGNGGGGSYGIYIQANEIIAGTINANGGNGNAGVNSAYGAGGGGGGGVILLAYGSGGYTSGTYNVSGGAGNSSSSGTAGNGGNGQVLTYNYSTQPITILNGFTYSTTSGYKNRLSSYNYNNIQTENTSPTTITSQSFTPQYTGLVVLKAVVQVSNNTAGDGVFVGLYNGSTHLDSETLISNSANQQQVAYLYDEILYTSPFSQQTFSIQYNAVNGGTASAEIQEFTIEEIY